MSGNIIRYLPGGKRIVVGFKAKDANPIFKYTPGNPKNALCPVQNAQPKNAKQMIQAGCANPVINCYIYDGGNSSSNFTNILNGAGTEVFTDAGYSNTIFCG